MKKITYSIGIAFTLLTASNAVAQQGFGTNRPEKSSAVEIKSTNKGLLIPRISLTGVADTSTITNPANSLIIYNLSTTNGMREGYYYYSTAKTKWIPLLDGNNVNTVSNGLQVDPNNANNFILGGNLDRRTVINTAGNDVLIQGLNLTTDLNNKVVAIGTMTGVDSGKVEVANIKDIVTAGIENQLSSTGNLMTSVVNGDSATANIINSNELNIDSNTTILKSNVNGVPAQVDLKDAIQFGQIKYNVLSADSSVTVTKTEANDVVTYDLKVADINSTIRVGNGIQKDLNDRVVLGGKLDTTTIIHTQGNDVKIQGLSQVDSMTNQMIAVGGKQDGLLKVASPEQIVAAGIKAENGVRIDTTTGSNVVKLGGALLENTVINADTNTLAITGLKIDTSTTNYMVVMGQDGVLKKTLMGSNNAVVYINGAGGSTSANAMSDMETIIVNTDSGSHTIVLPSATDGNKGKRYFIKKTGTNETNSLTITVDRGGKIDGEVTGTTSTDIISTLPYQSWIFQNDGTLNGWFIVGH